MHKPNTGKALALPTTTKAEPVDMVVTKPVVEIVSCMASCAGILASIQYVFDLRDNRTGKLFQNLVAFKTDNEWDLPFLYYKNQGCRMPLLVSINNALEERKFAEMAPFREIICQELNTWSRNLYLLAAQEAKDDDGLKEYAKIRQAVADEDHT